MAQVVLTEEQKKGARASILAVVFIFVLFVTVLVAGNPIMDFGTKAPSVAYALLVYLPVFTLCALAYRKLGRR